MCWLGCLMMRRSGYELMDWMMVVVCDGFGGCGVFVVGLCGVFDEWWCFCGI